MSLKSTYGPGKFALSFELFPPKTADGDAALFAHLVQLVKFAPAFVTCTYGAGGSTRAKTLDIIEQVKRRFQLPVASHLTCVGSTVNQLRAFQNQVWAQISPSHPTLAEGLTSSAQNIINALVRQR